jgi:hypothetical protein
MRRSGALAGLAAATALWVAPGADASSFAEAKLPAANGYTLRIEGLGGDVAVTAQRRGGGASYATAGRTGHGRLAVDLGRFGSVDLEFHGDGRGWHGRPCGREKRGTWRGIVRFVADRGFTSAFATQADGRLTRFRRGCGAARGLPKRAPQILTASHIGRDSRQRFTLFTALAFGGINLVSATRGYRDEGVAITSFADAQVPASRVRLDPDRGRAFVRPGEPFSGSARFREGADRRRRWRGDLIVELPGAGSVPLAGPRFAARFGQVEDGGSISVSAP